MRRILSFSIISLIAALTAACGSAQQTPETTAKAENSCVQPATPPKEGETPTCSDGCEWSGTECRMQRVALRVGQPLSPIQQRRTNLVQSAKGQLDLRLHTRPAEHPERAIVLKFSEGLDEGLLSPSSVDKLHRLRAATVAYTGTSRPSP